MAEFDFHSLAPQIRDILSAPGTDLATISAKRVRLSLVDKNPSLTPEFLKANKSKVDLVIQSVFEEVNGTADDANGSSDAKSEEREGVQEQDGHGGDEVDSEATTSRKRRQSEDPSEDAEDSDVEDDKPARPAKKAKKSRKVDKDAELARKLSSEINGRARRKTGKSKGAANGSPKKARKSAATVDSDSDGEGRKRPAKRKSGGGAKGGFAKEYILSDALAAVVGTDKLSRPQVVKQLWVYIRGHNLQNPSNRKEILCDDKFRAVFNTDKIDQFKMNKVLGQHLHENEG